MTETPTRFDVGAAYEAMMGRWSRLVGEDFLDWLALGPGLGWLDVGCGNGAFTELLVDRCAPAEVAGVDPSEGQLAYARARPASRLATFSRGDARSLPFGDAAFDVAVMALVINQIPEPATAVAEMARVVRPGGWIASYMWDLPGGGFTMEPIRRALADMEIATPIFGADVTSAASLLGLWRDARLERIEVRRIDVRLDYADFDDFWRSNTGSPNTVSRAMAGLPPPAVAQLRDRLRTDLPAAADGSISYGAFANAVKGRRAG